MSEPFLSEIRMMSFSFPPKGWALCNGQVLPINQNQALFALLGTTFGGDGQTNFALPDYRGRAPVHVGNGHALGERGGEQAHALSVSEMPIHHHTLQATADDADQSMPTGNLFARQAPDNAYVAPGSLGAMNDASISNAGDSQPHLNMQPYLTVSFCIAVQGIFPSPN
ncbi:phage tail protein [Wenzhouxiangella sp. AB-CW3]|uniref:phage tail protein n=1 Tax=Wenzhouxiangella sp. AB-CW3 TaxID=2771012 RepID=UPI00168AE6AD|nr:tail fiber protein [Wenzhouxiangella sp. AB-CW3]QOC22934.1 phage tail protein [Wenzhouxiangella sp. AB-CW3]